MPQTIDNFAMVPSPNGKGVIVLGDDTLLHFAGVCSSSVDDENENQMVIMELNGDTLEWKILDQKLDVCREYSSAIPIGYEFDLEMFSEKFSAKK